MAKLLEAGWACCGVVVDVGQLAFAANAGVIRGCLPAAFAACLAFPAFVFADREGGRHPLASPICLSGAFSIGRDVEELRLLSKEPLALLSFPFALLFFSEGLREFHPYGQPDLSEADP